MPDPTEPRDDALPTAGTPAVPGQPAGMMPPVGTAAYERVAGPTQALGPSPRGRHRKAAALFGVLGLVVGLGAGIGIGYGAFHSSSPAALAFPGGRGFPGRFGFGAGPGRAAGASGSSAGTGFPRFGASGKVASVSGSTLEVQGAAGQTTVQVSGSTTVTKTVSGSASDITTGVCVRAVGQTSSNGTVTATSIVITQPVNGTCTGGFPGARRFAPGGPAA